MKGLTTEEESALRVIFSLTPWKRDKLSKSVGKYLDGDTTALDKTPILKARVTNAARTIRKAI